MKFSYDLGESDFNLNPIWISIRNPTLTLQTSANYKPGCPWDCSLEKPTKSSADKDSKKKRHLEDSGFPMAGRL